jgi:hypothetical protein
MPLRLIVTHTVTSVTSAIFLVRRYKLCSCVSTYRLIVVHWVKTKVCNGFSLPTINWSGYKRFPCQNVTFLASNFCHDLSYFVMKDIAVPLYVIGLSSLFFSSYTSSQALQSVVDLDFQHNLSPFLPISGHCVPISYYHYLQTFFIIISLLISVVFFFTSFLPFCQSLLALQSFMINFNMSIRSDRFCKFYIVCCL